MPYIRVSLIEPYNQETVEVILDTVKRACEIYFDAEPHKTIAQAVSIKHDDVLLPPAHSKRLVVIEITLYSGRSEEKKQGFCGDVRGILSEALSLPIHDIYFIFNDKEPSDINAIHPRAV